MKPPKFTLKTSIDFIRFSIMNKDIETLRNIILSNPEFKKTRPFKVTGKWDWVDGYSLVPLEKQVKLLSPFKPYLPAIIKIEEPNQNALDYFQNFAVKNNIDYKISCIELTFDFLVKGAAAVNDMKNFLVRHAYLKYLGKEFHLDVDTFYIGNIRSCKSKAVRIYAKDPERKARLELILKRRLLKRNGIETVNELNNNALNQIVAKSLIFKELDLILYAKRYLKKIGSENEHLTDDQAKDLVRQEIYTIIHIQENQGINDAFRYMKKRISHEYDYISEHEFSKVFFDRISKRKYC